MQKGGGKNKEINQGYLCNHIKPKFVAILQSKGNESPKGFDQRTFTNIG